MHEIDNATEEKPKKNGFLLKVKRVRNAVAALLMMWAVMMAIYTTLRESEITERQYYELNRDLSLHPECKEAFSIAEKLARDGKITYSERSEIYEPILEYDETKYQGSKEKIIRILKGSK